MPPSWPSHRYFNPPTRKGWDVTGTATTTGVALFQSTHPQGWDVAMTALAETAKLVFNPPTRKGGTTNSVCLTHDFLGFQSTHPQGWETDYNPKCNSRKKEDNTQPKVYNEVTTQT